MDTNANQDRLMTEERHTKVTKVKKATKGRRNRKFRYKPKIHYVSTDAFDIDKLTIGLSFFDHGNVEMMMMKFEYNYEYAPGLVSQLNLLHEGSRVYASALPGFAQNDRTFEYLKLNAPIRYNDAHNAALKADLDLIKAKLIDFLCAYRNRPIQEVIDTYASEDIRKEQLVKKLHRSFSHLDDRAIAASFEPRRHGNRHNYDSDSENEDEHRPQYDPEVYRMLPRIRSATKITKLGSKKSGYQNEEVDMKTFYESLMGYKNTNKDDAEYYYVCNMIIGISSYFIDRDHIGESNVSFRPDCSKFEYRWNKSACKRAIKMKKIEQPVILRGLSV